MRFMPRSRGGALWRFFFAAVIVIGGTAATTAVAGLLQFKQFAADISLTPPLPHANVTLPAPGQPQTILIVGSDHRAGEPYKTANTDTMLLVRLNAGSQTINVLAVPRDLEVNIPGVGSATHGEEARGGWLIHVQSLLEARQPPPVAPVQARPRTIRPVEIPVGCASFRANLPLMMTSVTPVAYCCGFS